MYPSSQTDVHLMKYDYNGNVLFSVTYGGPGGGSDLVGDMVIDGNGDILIAAGITGVNSNYDIGLLKFDKNNLNLIFSRLYNGTFNGIDGPYDMDIDASGNICVVGESQSSDDPPPGGDDPNLKAFTTIKYNSNGIINWVKFYQATGEQPIAKAYSVKISNSEIYVTGFAYEPDHERDYITIKYNLSGIQQWIIKYNGLANHDDIANSISVDNEGYIYVTGKSKNNFSGDPRYYDLTTQKYCPNDRQLIFEQRYNGSDNLEDAGIKTRLHGNILYAAGYTQSLSTDKDYVLAKYSSEWEDPDGGDMISGTINSLSINESGELFGTSSIGKIFKSIDNGLNWDQLNTPVNNHLRSIKFINNVTGFAAGNNGNILKSSDSGNSWFSQNNPVNENINNLYFVNSSTGFGVCDNGKIIFTTNSGLDWRVRNLNIANRFNKIKFSGSNAGFIAASNGYLLKTANLGQTWTVQNISSGIDLRDVFICSQDTVFICGSGGKILKSVNGGLNWNMLSSGTVLNLNSLFFFDCSYGFVAGDGGLILCTIDGGLNWKKLNSKTNENLNALIFKDKNTGIAVGENGIVRLTTLGTFNNGGLNRFSSPMKKGNDEIIPYKFELGQNYPNPFNPSTQIRYNIGRDCYVTVKVYNSIGQEVIKIVNNEYKTAGQYSIIFDGTNLPSGIYFYKIYAGSYSETKKMILVK